MRSTVASRQGRKPSLRHSTTTDLGLASLFIRLSRSANDCFQIPTGRVVEVGTQVTIQGA
jgi:K+ transporter